MYKIFLMVLAAMSMCGSVKASNDPILKVQEMVNLSLIFEAESEGKDNWKIPTRFADCEDYALLKRKLLIERFSYSPEDLQLIIVRMPAGGGHVVLYVKSRNLILDNPSSENKRQNLKPVAYTEYLTKTGNKFYCVVSDLSLGHKNASDRCQK